MADTPADGSGSGKPLSSGLVRLNCAGDMIGSEVMAFVVEGDDNGSCDLSITTGDLLDLWGPGTFISCPTPRPENWLLGIAIRGGVLYKPSTDAAKMHWTAARAEDMHGRAPFKLDPSTKVIIGAILVDPNCPTEPGPSNTVLRTNISIDIKELGTSRARWDMRERQSGVQAGQYLNVMLNATWIKRDTHTQKKKGLERVDLDILDQPWGLLVSVCTGVAQRVALREVIAEVMLPIVCAYIDGLPEWQTLMSTGEGLLEELKKSTFRDWFSMLDYTAQRALGELIHDVLCLIHWTGVNDDCRLVIACPQYGDSTACIHLPLKKFFSLCMDSQGHRANRNFCLLDKHVLQ
jgi:hypothetical protein